MKKENNKKDRTIKRPLLRESSESERIKRLMDKFPQECMSFDKFLKQLGSAKGYVSFGPDRSKS